MPFNPYTSRVARVTVSVSRPDASGNAATQTYRFQQHRMRIGVRQGGAHFSNAKVEIYGVPLDAMNQIARLWLEALTPLGTDTIQLDVLDGKDFVPFFQGVIAWSAVNASAMPQVCLEIEANSGMALMIQSASPYASGSTVLLKDALTTIAAPAGFAVDYPDTVPQFQLSQVRVTGSAMEQISELMNHFPQLTWSVSLQRVQVRAALAPINSNAVRIAADTGLMGYPVYSTSSLQLATLFNPKITPGVALDVQTEFDFVNRTTWVASVLTHTLEPNLPGGQWTTQIAANSFGAKGNGN